MKQISEDENRLRNVLSIRFRDAEHRAITDFAWRQRRSCSDLVREVTLEHLQRAGIEVAEYA